VPKRPQLNVSAGDQDHPIFVVVVVQRVWRASEGVALKRPQDPEPAKSDSSQEHVAKLLDGLLEHVAELLGPVPVLLGIASGVPRCAWRRLGLASSVPS